MKKKLLIVIVLVAALLRLYKLGQVPSSMYIDEVAIGVDAKSIAQTGRDMHGNSMFSTMFPSYGDYKLPVYVWLAAGSVKLFGATEFAVRLPSAVAGIASVLLVYAIARELFETNKNSENIAIYSAAATALLPWSILFSRTGFEGHVGQAFVLCSILFALYARRNPRWYIAVAATSALAVYTYFSIRFVLPVVLIAIVVCWFTKKTWKVHLPWMLISAALIVAFIAPLFMSRYYKPSEQVRLSTTNVLTNTQPILYANDLRAEDGNSFYSKLLHHRDVYILKDLTRNLFTHLEFPYLFLHGDSNLRHSTTKTGLMLLAFAPFFFAGLYVLVRRYPRVAVLLCVWYFISIVPASVPSSVPHALRSINGLGVLALICGLGAYELFHWLSTKKRRKLGYVIAGALFFTVVVNFFAFMHDYYFHYPQRSANAWYVGAKNLATFVAPYVNTNTDVQVSMTDDKQFIWLLFYGNFDFNTVQKADARSYLFTKVGNVELLSESSMKFVTPNTIYVGLHDEALKRADVQSVMPKQGEALKYIQTAQ